MGESGSSADLQQGRDAFGRRAWGEARHSLTAAEEAGSLAAADLEMLATATYMLGDDLGYSEALERAHHAHLGEGDLAAAARCGFWVGLRFLIGGEGSVAAGWFARCERLLDRAGGDRAERGYLLLPGVIEKTGAGEWQQAAAIASEAAAIAERSGDRDLLALALHEQAHALLRQSRTEEGLRLLDEAMVAAVAGELSPITTGIVYCSAIAYCQELFELRRAHEWTDALSRWCDEQPEMVAHTGVCLTHRAEVMERRGRWREAIALICRRHARSAGRITRAL